MRTADEIVSKLKEHPPTTPFQKIRNVIEPLSGGIRGQTFCSTLQLSRSFKMLSASYKGGFFGNYFRMGKMVLCFFSKMNMALTQVALVARPCAPAAQHSDESSSSRSRLAKSYDRFAPLTLKQDCFFRVSSSKIKISLPGPPAADSVMIFHPEASSSKLRSDSFQKFATASQTLVFEKQSSLRVYRFSENRCIIKP